jgi:hypothetical protein
MATHFSRLLRHAWITVGLFLFPGHHTGDSMTTNYLNFTQHTTHLVQGAHTPGIKPPRREADYSPQSSADVKNAWSYTFIPQIRLHGVVLS